MHVARSGEAQLDVSLFARDKDISSAESGNVTVVGTHAIKHDQNPLLAEIDLADFPCSAPVER